MTNKEAKVINLNIKITPELYDLLIEKAKSYGIANGNNNGVHSLASLCEFMGFLVLLKAEDQIKDVGKYSPKDAISMIVRNMDIGATSWCWSVKNFMQPSIKMMSVEQMLIKGLEKIKADNKNQEDNL